ncbi:hypothetical protein BH23ACT9_BH23ACT9_04790 [soil metagenome]
MRPGSAVPEGSPTGSDRGPPNDYLLGTALLNGVAIVMKGIGAAAAIGAVRRTLPHHLGGPVLAVLVTAVATLGAAALLGFGVIALDGALLDSVSLAGGTFTIIAWASPAFFLIGALAFAAPVPQMARRVAALPRTDVRRWIAVGALAGPPAAIGTIVAVGTLLTAAGLLPG